jgi:hypothetical protein
VKRPRVVAAASLALASLIALTAGAPASAGTGGSFPVPDENSFGSLNSVAINQPAPVDTTVITTEEINQGNALDFTSNLAVTGVLTADKERSINTVTWDSERDVLHFYAHKPDRELNTLIAETLPEDQKWDIVPSIRSIAEVESFIEGIAADPTALPAGMTFVSGKPAADGSSITIGVEGDTASTFRSAPLPDRIDDIPVTFIEEEPAETTTRVRNVSPVIAGGYMSGPASAGNMACSTGFPVLRSADNQPNMITADHCTDLQGATWNWGTGTHSVGNSTFQAAGGTDLELFIGPDSLSAWVFVGSYTDASTVAPIRGYVAPVGGNNACYSGSRSGLVCSNVLESSDTYNCVAFLQCYWTRWSTQSAGTPAAGNGDSGGPVVILALRESDNSVGAYGVGAISMIPGNSSAACTGDPGSTATDGRRCSANVGFAPLSRWASAQSTHNLAYTNS